MRRIIREKDPRRPFDEAEHARPPPNRPPSPRSGRWRRQAAFIWSAGDLDWIVMKCLEKDRTRRYETANGLARDIERHLRDERSRPGRPRRFYRMQKSQFAATGPPS